MAAPKKKAPARKQKAAAAKKPKAQAKAAVKKIARVTVAEKAKPAPRAKTSVAKNAKVQVKAKAKKKTVLHNKAVAKKPAKKVVAAKTAVAPKKGKGDIIPSSERFRGLKSMLIAKRDALLKEAKLEIQKYVSGENRQLVDTAIDEADWAAVEISEDINLKRLSAQRQLLSDVEECLRKVSEGTYGICEDCGEEISEKRLQVIPTATLCIDCKEQREKMAILEQETEV